MKFKFLIFLHCLFFSLCANDPVDISTLSINLSAECEPLTTVSDCVNIISGRFFQTDTDLITSTIEPLSISRYYDSSSGYENFLGWGFATQFPIAASQPQFRNKYFYAMIDEREGFAIPYKGTREKETGKRTTSCKIDPRLLEKGYTNLSLVGQSGHANFVNWQAVFEYRDKDDPTGRWAVRLGDGTIRYYGFSLIHLASSGYQAYSEVTNLLSKEIKPNGNEVHFNYEFHRDMPYLKKITTHNRNGKILNELTFQHSQKGCLVRSSCGKQVNYEQELETHEYKDKEAHHKKTKMILKRVVSNQTSPTKYHLGHDTDHKEFLRVAKIEKESRKHFVDITYDKKHRVVKLKEPFSDKVITSYTFDYDDDCTHVYDVKNQRTTYRFSTKDSRLNEINYYDQNKKIREDRFDWTMNGWLLSKAVCLDHKFYYKRAYEYDERGNILSETIFGNLTGIKNDTFKNTDNTDSHTTNYTYTANNHLKRKITPEGIRICYEYEPGTNLITSEIQKYNGSNQERCFTKYDPSGQIRQIIEDDGSGDEESDLNDVSYRKIKTIEVVTKPIFVSFGKPKNVIEEYILEDGTTKRLKRTAFQYDAQGFEIMQRVFNDQDIRCYDIYKKYDARHRVIEETDPEGQITQFSYDVDNNKTWEKIVGTDTETEIYYEYDNKNRLIRKEEYHTTKDITGEEIKEHFMTRYVYNALGQLIIERDQYHNKTSYEYDRMGNQIKCIKPAIVGPSGETIYPTVTKEYNILNQVISETDENGFTTYTSYNVYGKPTQITYPDDSKEYYVYYPNGWLKRKWHANGSSTYYEYNPKGKVTKESTLDDQGNLIKEEERIYKGPLLKSKKDVMGMVTFYEYDRAGRKIEERTEEKITKFEYDSLGRQAKIIHCINNNDQQCERYEYDNLDRMTAKFLIDQNGTIYAEEYYKYDRKGNQILTAVNHTESHVANFKKGYYADGSLFWQEDALGNRTIFKYDHKNFVDPLEQKICRRYTTDPLGRITIEEEDALHQIRKREVYEQDKLIKSTFFSYDAAGQKVLQKDVVLEDQLREYTVKWEYDSNGKIISESESNGKTTFFEYDEMGNLKEKIKPDGTVFEYSYDLLGRLTKMTAPGVCYTYHWNLYDKILEVNDCINNSSQKRFYDQYGRLFKEELSPNITLTYTYDLVDRLLCLHLPDNSEVLYEYDPFYLKKIKRIKSNGQLNYEYEFQAYNLIGKQLKTKSPACIAEYKYDLLGRTVEIKTPIWEEKLLQFDKAGNLLKLWQKDPLGEIEGNFVYDELNQIVSEKGTDDNTYQFDSLGNCFKKNETHFEINHLNQITNHGCTYNANGCLINALESAYQYDALDRLISCHTNGQETIFVFDSSDRCLFLREPDGQRQLLYQGLQEIGSWKDGKINEFKLIHPEDYTTLAIELEEEVYFPILDHRYNICCLQNREGTVVECVRYSAFGEETCHSSIQNPWRFASRRKVADLLLFSHRFYNPSLMRWQTPDPLGYEDGPNLYSYVHNNPFTHIDLFGLQDLDLRGLGFWQRWETLSCDTLVAQADFSPTYLSSICWSGFATGFAEGYFDPVSAASKSFSDLSFERADPCAKMNAMGQRTGEITGALTNAVNIAANGLKSSLVGLIKFGGKNALTGAVESINQKVKVDKQFIFEDCPSSLNLDLLSKSGQIKDRNGLSRAGRALDKHGNRPGSPFPKATGNSESKNVQGQYHLDDILTHPKSRFFRENDEYGFYAPDGRGIFFRRDGSFRGFLRRRQDGKNL